MLLLSGGEVMGRGAKKGGRCGKIGNGDREWGGGTFAYSLFSCSLFALHREKS